MVLPERVRKYVPEKVVFEQNLEDAVGLFTIKKVRRRTLQAVPCAWGLAWSEYVKCVMCMGSAY